ncbi:DUF6192 family protein [Streptomyces sp. NPDC002643]
MSKIRLSREQKFELGDLLLAMTERVPSGHGERHMITALFAEEIGIPIQRLERYRRVAAAWPPDKRHPEVSWTVHEILAPYPDRFKILKKPPKVRLTDRFRMRFVGDGGI